MVCGVGDKKKSLNIDSFFASREKHPIFAPLLGAISSAGSEHLPYKQGVTGSNPVSPTVERHAVTRRNG